MGKYNADRIKNIALAGHGGSGKTSLAEGMLYLSKTTDRLGRIADGNTVCDCDPEEIKRLASLSLSLAPFVYKDIKINLIDTPGMFDFAAGMYEGISAADSVIIVVSGKSGVTVGAKKAYQLASKMNKPKAIFVSKLDADNSSYFKVLEQLKTAFGPAVCPVQVPFYDNFHERIKGYVDLVDMKAYEYGENGAESECEVPQSDHRLEGLNAAISEAVAETDEKLFDKYFSGEQFTHEELVTGIHNGVKNGDIAPVFCGSGAMLLGVRAFMDGIAELLPSAAESKVSDVMTDDGEEIKVNENDPLCARVFKTIADPFVGKMSFIKVISGKLHSEANVVNMSTGDNEKIGKLMYVFGKRQDEVDELSAGDIGAAAKLNANTGDILCDASRKLTAMPVEFPKPCYNMAIKMQGKGDESKISQGIHRLLDEDSTLGFTVNDETHEQIISGLGDQHLDVAKAKLKSKFGVDVSLAAPTVAYRETIRKGVKVEGKHKKQTGGHGQFGHVWIEFEPCDSEELVFEEKVFGGSVPKGFFPAVEKGLREAAQHGVVAGYPMVGLKATLVDGSYHPVDSSEMSFKMAANLAYKAGIPQATPVLLEPIGSLKVYVPDSNTGDMMGELNKRRGRVLGMNPAGEGMTLIEAEVPMSEMQDFTMLVRQMTQGAGWFEFEFVRYEQLPSHLEKAVIEAAAHKE